MRYLGIICLSVLLSSRIYGQVKSAKVTGNWTASVTAPITEAGLNYTASVVSATNQTLIEIDGEKDNSAYTVSIHKQDGVWDANLTFWARRTGTGIGNNATITGGLNYIQLNSVAQYFFNGTVSRGGGSKVADVPIQYEIRGLSVLIPVRVYSTTIVYTFTNP